MFQTASEMPYANSDQIKNKAKKLFVKLIDHLKTVKKAEKLFFRTSETVCIPDIHGDFVHLVITLYRHDVLKKDLNLDENHEYIFLGDFYDRAPDSDVIDLWLNNQIRNNLKIYRLVGNHEMAFFERNENGHPVISPSQDSIKDISNDFRITEDLLKNIANGNILAAYVDKKNLYIHSYVINDDYIELGLEPNSDILYFAHTLNKRFQLHGQDAYDLFMKHKKDRRYNWKTIMKSFNDDPLFNLYTSKNDIHTSFIWRRTGLPTLKIYPCELDVAIPDDVYQIVGHTPVSSFDLPKDQLINKPFVLNAKNGTGKIQFSDVGIGYYYKNDFERPEVFIKPLS